MTETTKLLINEYKKEFGTYYNYMKENEWLHDVFLNNSGRLTSGVFDTHNHMVSTIIDSLKKFVDEADEDINTKPVRNFLEFCNDIISYFIKSIDEYIDKNPLDSNSGEEDFLFRSSLFKLKTKYKADVTKLDLTDGGNKKSINIFNSDIKAPLLMREILCEKVPIVKEKTNNLGIDFNADIICEFNHNKIFINIPEEDVPKWDATKHFFEQDEYTIRFWEQEIRKCKNGLMIGTYHMSGWLYYHINHFRLNYGEKEDKGYKPPQLRDNEYYIDEVYKRAVEHGRQGVLTYGTRRFSKSVGMASRMSLSALLINDAKISVQGFSEKPDLEALFNYIEENFSNAPPALHVPMMTSTIKDGIKLGLKGKKAQDVYPCGDIMFLNLENGNTKKGTQKTAGGTPDFSLYDEVAKGDVTKPWSAALPSFEGGINGKWRCYPPLLAGTAGEAALSEQTERILKDPETYSVMPMQWDILNFMVEPEYRTWNEVTFATFVPAQMSVGRVDKISKKLSEFLKIEIEPELDIEIMVTNWKASKEWHENKRNQLSKDLGLLASEICSYPLTPEDCYVTAEVNKFPGLEAKQRKTYIEQHGLGGQKVRLSRTPEGTIVANQTADTTIDVYPFKGTNMDAPIVMLDDPYSNSNHEPPLGLYCMGFDDVKHNKTDGDSVMSATVFKRSYEGGEWANRIVAFYDSRPDRKETYYKQLYLLMKYYNCRVLYENDDSGFLEWMERNYMSDIQKHFSNGIGLASEDNLFRNKNRSYGWSASADNIYRLEERIVAYTRQENVIVGDTEGLGGVDLINHSMLLEELYKYKKGKNADRIRSFGLALTLAQYYDKTYQYIKGRNSRFKSDDQSYKRKEVYSTKNGLPVINTGLTRW